MLWCPDCGFFSAVFLSLFWLFGIKLMLHILLWVIFDGYLLLISY